MCIRIVLQYRCRHTSRYTTTRACISPRCDGRITRDEVMSSVNLCEDCEERADDRFSAHKPSASAGRSHRNASSRGFQFFEDERPRRISSSGTSTSRRPSHIDRSHWGRAPSPDENRDPSQSPPRYRSTLDADPRRAVQSVSEEYGSQAGRESIRAWRNRTERGLRWMR